jgi:3-oxoacyl-[acyl-carrier-protein] synthase II
MNHPSRRVVVTGLGAITPIGLSVPAFWRALLDGRSGAGPITYFDTSAFGTHFACELKGFDPLDHTDRKTARRLDPFAQYALAAANEALHDAQIKTDSLTDEQRERIGVVFGSAIGGLQTLQKQTTTYVHQGPDRISPFCVPMMMTNMATAQITIQHQLRGPSHSVVSACATGNNNIGDGYHIIQRDEADIILCGGSEASICELAIGAFNSMKALSTRNESPTTASRPFDATRDGFVMGEGAGALVLESLEHAQARNAYIYAEVIGMGESSDAYHITAPIADGQQRAMQQVLRRAGIAPEDVDYINMHSTSTPLGDAVETNAIKAIFGEHAYRMHVSATKSMTGHLFGAAGAVEAIATILAIKQGKIPPTTNFEQADPDCDLNYTFNAPAERSVDVALSNSFGFGGHNTCVGFRKLPQGL